MELLSSDVTGATLTKQSDTAYTLSDAQATIVVDDVEPFTITYDLNGGTVDGNPMTYYRGIRLLLRIRQKKIMFLLDGQVRILKNLLIT